jgi:hypothetical protein
MCLTPGNRHCSQGGIAILVLLLSNPVRMHPLFKPSESSLTTDGMTQVCPHVLILN